MRRSSFCLSVPYLLSLTNFFEVDPSRVQHLLLGQTPCQDGVMLATQSLTVFRSAVGPFTVHPLTVPANATVRFAVTGLFSAYEAGSGLKHRLLADVACFWQAQYCRFRMTWSEMRYPMQLSERVRTSFRLNGFTDQKVWMPVPHHRQGASSAHQFDLVSLSDWHVLVASISSMANCCFACQALCRRSDPRWDAEQLGSVQVDWHICFALALRHPDVLCYLHSLDRSLGFNKARPKNPPGTPSTLLAKGVAGLAKSDRVQFWYEKSQLGSRPFTVVWL